MREPRPSDSSAPSATNSFSIRDHDRSARVGSSKIPFRVFRCRTVRAIVSYYGTMCRNGKKTTMPCPASVLSPKYGYYISERNGAGFGGATTSQCSFITRRSDSKDGVVPPEPVGPMEVAGRQGRADRAHTHYRSIQRPRCVWQHPSEIVIVFRRQDTSTQRSAFSLQLLRKRDDSPIRLS